MVGSRQFGQVSAPFYGPNEVECLKSISQNIEKHSRMVVGKKRDRFEEEKSNLTTQVKKIQQKIYLIHGQLVAGFGSFPL